MTQITQEQQFWMSHRKNSDNQQHAAWMCGKLKDDDGKFISNPLTQDEIDRIAHCDKPYAHYYKPFATRS